MVGWWSVVDGDDKAGGFAAVDGLVAVADAGGVAGLGEGEGDVVVLVRAADVHAGGLVLRDAFGGEPADELDHAEDGGAVLFGDGDGVGNVVHVTVGEEEEVDLVGELVAFGKFGIVLDEGVDEDGGPLRGLDEDGGVTQPGDGGALEIWHRGKPLLGRLQVAGYRLQVGPPPDLVTAT